MLVNITKERERETKNILCVCVSLSLRLCACIYLPLSLLHMLMLYRERARPRSFLIAKEGAGGRFSYQRERRGRSILRAENASKVPSSQNFPRHSGG